MFRNKLILSQAKPSSIPGEADQINLETRLLFEALVINYPETQFFDARNILTDNHQAYCLSVPDPERRDQTIKKHVTLSQSLVRYQRKKNPAEYRYAVCQYLAEGGEGVVYKSDATLKLVATADGNIKAICKQKTDPKKVRIVKQLHPHKQANGLIQYDRRGENQKARREWSFMDRVSMPGLKTPICTKDNSRAALVMHHIEGKELYEYLETEDHFGINFTVDQLIDLTIVVGEAILKVHAAGIIHRDLKPENIIVKLDQHNNAELAVVIDFGMAKWKNERNIIEDVGSPTYLAPEARFNHSQDEKSDAYAFAKILIFLWKMNTDRPRHLKLSTDHRDRLISIMRRSLHVNQNLRASIVDMMSVFNDIKAQRAADKMKAPEIEASKAVQSLDHDQNPVRDNKRNCTIC